MNTQKKNNPAEFEVEFPEDSHDNFAGADLSNDNDAGEPILGRVVVTR
jgi:hypothetical protein